MATNPVISMVQAFFITASLCLGGNPGYTGVTYSKVRVLTPSDDGVGFYESKLVERFLLWRKNRDSRGS